MSETARFDCNFNYSQAKTFQNQLSETARFDCNFNYSQAKTFQNQLSYPTSQRVEQIRYSYSGAFFDSGGVFFCRSHLEREP